MALFTLVCAYEPERCACRLVGESRIFSDVRSF